MELPECFVKLEKIDTTPEAIEKLVELHKQNYEDGGVSYVSGSINGEEEKDSSGEEYRGGRRRLRERVKRKHSADGVERTSQRRKLRERMKKPRRRIKKESALTFDKLLDGVTFVLSGFEDPLKAELREKGLALGAGYNDQWTEQCTHLVCAWDVPNTEEYKMVKASEGNCKIVRENWILDSHKDKCRLPWRRYCFDREDEGLESEGEIREGDSVAVSASEAEFSGESEGESEDVEVLSSGGEDYGKQKSKKQKQREVYRSSRISARKKDPGWNYNEDTGSSSFEESGSDVEDLRGEAEAPRVKKGTAAPPKNYGFCQKCKSWDTEQLLLCDTCPWSMHCYCLTPKLKEKPSGRWSCPKCTTPQFLHPVEEILSWRWKAGCEQDDMQREFFIKWKGLSHYECEWVDETPLDIYHKVRLRTYCQKNDMENPPNFEDDTEYASLFLRKKKHKPCENGASGCGTSGREEVEEEGDSREKQLLQKYYSYGVRPEWLQIHRVINHRVHEGRLEYLTRWKDITCDKATWMGADNEFNIPDFEKHVTLYKEYRFALTGQVDFGDEEDEAVFTKGYKFKYFHPPPPEATTLLEVHYDSQPTYLGSNCTLHPYQLQGLNWLRHSYSQGTTTILADEMGLGKTIQAITFLYSLYKEGHSNGPFLIAAPLSTILNWEREFETWAPDFYVVTYTGLQDGRQVLRKNELLIGDSILTKKLLRSKKQKLKFHVLLTSYEFVSMDKLYLGAIPWAVLVVDEAQRLKSQKSLFFQVLSQYELDYRLLLTGTPLQNNLEELYNLLNFLEPKKFNDLEKFQEKFDDVTKEEQVRQLHDILGPHMLRRLKADVFKDIPSKSELIVRVEMTPVQKKYYKCVLTKNFEALNVKNCGRQTSLMNIMMDLRKCCNHPYLFSVGEAEAPRGNNGAYEVTALVEASGKMILLRKMLRLLKEEGHRVLIFSQMTRMMDILEDFFDGEGYKFERIDGHVDGRERQEAIDRFNREGAEQFIFLLSTRAGGLGINLATADTVIIFDSDWNPHNDIQALSRAHRIGQAKKVMIYRFVTRGTAEERIAQVAKQKLMLEQLVVRAASFSRAEIDDVIKFGTEELFANDENAEEIIQYNDEAVRKLLDRSQEDTEQKENWANDYLASFKVASYATAAGGGGDNQHHGPSTSTHHTNIPSKRDPFYWNKLIGSAAVETLEAKKAPVEDLGFGKRKRKQISYKDHGVDRKEKEKPSVPYLGTKSRPRKATSEDEEDEEFRPRMSDVSTSDEEEVQVTDVVAGKPRPPPQLLPLTYHPAIVPHATWDTLFTYIISTDTSICHICRYMCRGNDPKSRRAHLKISHKEEFHRLEAIRNQRYDAVFTYSAITNTSSCNLCGNVCEGQATTKERKMHMKERHNEEFDRIQGSKMTFSELSRTIVLNPGLGAKRPVQVPIKKRVDSDEDNDDVPLANRIPQQRNPLLASALASRVPGLGRRTQLKKETTSTMTGREKRGVPDMIEIVFDTEIVKRSRNGDGGGGRIKTEGAVPELIELDSSDNSSGEQGENHAQPVVKMVSGPYQKRGPRGPYKKKQKMIEEQQPVPVFVAREVGYNDTVDTVFTLDPGSKSAQCQLCGKKTALYIRSRTSHLQNCHVAEYNFMTERGGDSDSSLEVEIVPDNSD